MFIVGFYEWDEMCVKHFMDLLKKEGLGFLHKILYNYGRSQLYSTA